MKKLITISGMFLLIATSKSQTTVQIEPPTDDAYIYVGSPNNNYGTSPNLAVGYASGSEMRMLIKWNLSSLPNCISVTDAQIRLYQTTTNSSITTDIYRINSSWSQASVTWNNQPTTIGWYGSQTFSSTSGVKYIPATNLVQDWLANGNNGVMFKINLGTSYQMFDSKEASGADPRLIITYTTLTPPTANISGNTNICGGESTTLTASGGTSYLWNTGATTSSITVSPSINTQYCVTVTDANGCTDQTCATVNVTPSVTPSVLISASSINICSGDQVIFTATPTNGGSSPSYQWKLNGGNVGTNSSTYSNSSLSNGDQVYCIMTSNANCANPTTATSNTITISVNPLPVAQFSASNTNIDAGVCINYNDLSSGNPTSWSWTFSGAAPNSSTLKNPTNICYNTAGTYQVSLTATNSCGSDTESKLSYIDVSTGINELKTNSIKIFPNPVKEKLIVQFENSQKGKFILLNIFGQEIYNQQISGEKIEIGLSEFSEGIYFLIVETEKRIFREKIFVVR